VSSHSLEVFVCCAKDVGGYGKGKVKGPFSSRVGPGKVSGGWF
jgi:hypothetical protein